ncbi:uncharacterized protein N0V89_003614 [Didymosphaeria variabile]|uniref:EF-hand superfamily Ca2+-modulated protein n=1 Tax=Didymosphaeria variabile TaxID=1932322 RepID=A0A9W8XND3_9PLEO|nr:uncharacterized protein N0V89_003614 [Didymosphaeria variabile]KAJ4355594.1 hypothetical protein N0V89_003614 [Didymosphaeria variabile]
MMTQKKAYYEETTSLNLGPEKSELPEILSTIDPLETGFVPFIPFLSYAAIAIHTKDDSEEEDNGDEDDDDNYHDENDQEQVNAAFKLFTHGGPGPITLAHLRRVAKELKEDVPDDVLKDMIREANGGVKGKGKDTGGVGVEDFESVLRRAGVSFG